MENKLLLVPVILHISDLREENRALDQIIKQHKNDDQYADAITQWAYNENRINELWNKYHEIYADLQLNEWHVDDFVGVYGPFTGPVVFNYIQALR